MRKGIPIIAALLAACGGAAVTNNAFSGEAEASAQRGRGKPNSNAGLDDARAAVDYTNNGGVFGPEDRATAAGADSWAGRYSGPAAEGMQGTATVTASGPNRYRVSIEIAGPGCSGSVQGSATATGNRLNLVAPVSDGGDQCRISLQRRGGQLVVTEQDNCFSFHGAQCAFNATLSRRAGSAASAPARPAPTAAASSWLIGGWVPRGEVCGGEGLVFEVDGQYYGIDDAGRWSLTGNTLSFTVLERLPEGGYALEYQRLPRPVVVRNQIVARTARSFSMRHANGRVIQWMRCR